ncbi:MAG: hypothetical protein VX834_04705 [Myxococcota bacterium]|nr:hypothetical protein [Myxococcota bacterium]
MDSRLAVFALFASFLFASGCGQRRVIDVDSRSASTPNGTEVTQDTTSRPSEDESALDSDAPHPGVDDPGDNPNQPDPTPPGQNVGPCESTVASASNVMLPLDIIWIVDGSPSMDDEIAIVEANFNAFAESIGGSGLDYRVVLIGADHDHYDPSAQRSFHGICIPPPLSGAAGCPDTDSDRFLHIRRGVHSHDALEAAMATYDQYQQFLRPHAVTHFVAITDDDTGYSAGEAEFTAFIASATAPGFPEGITFHSIVDLVGYDPNCIWDDSCSCGESRGQNYIGLSEATGGIVSSICDETWGPIFSALEENVILGTTMPCDFTIPEPDVGLGIDPEQTNVVLVSEDGQTRETLFNVSDGSACENLTGWYFDSPATPTQVHLCPSACGAVNGSVEIEFGCETVKF